MGPLSPVATPRLPPALSRCGRPQVPSAAATHTVEALHPDAASPSRDDAVRTACPNSGEMVSRGHPVSPGTTRSRRKRPGEESTAAGIYGIIVSAAVMAATHADSAAAVAVAVLVTLAIYWAAERYSRLVAERIHDGRRPTWRQVRLQLTTGWEIVSASALPLVVLVVMGVLGAELYVAVLAALGCSTVLLCLAGWEVGSRGQLTTAERIVSATVAGIFGVAMILLKAGLH